MKKKEREEKSKPFYNSLPSPNFHTHVPPSSSLPLRAVRRRVAAINGKRDKGDKGEGRKNEGRKREKKKEKRDQRRVLIELVANAHFYRKRGKQIYSQQLHTPVIPSGVLYGGSI